MSINSIEFATKFTGALDKVACETSAVGFMTDNVMRAQFIGAKTVKIPSVDLEGLGDYDRETGFIKGAIRVSNSLYEMQQDRARSFTIDREDLDESGVAELAGGVMSEFVRTKVVPETDAYVISKLTGLAHELSQTVEYDSSNPFGTFSSLMKEAQDAAGFDEELVCFVNPTVWSAFRNSEQFARFITVSDFKQGEIHTQVHKIDNVAIIPVPQSRMQSAYDFLSGGEGESEGGFVPAAGAKGIYMLMLPKKAASLVRKCESVRTFTPEQNIGADAYKFDYRLYYDVFVKTSYKPSVWAALAPAITISSDLSPTVNKTAGAISGSLSVTATAEDSATISYQWYTCDGTLKENAKKVKSATSASLTIPTTLTAGDYYYFVRLSVNGSTEVDSIVCNVKVAAAE